MSKYKNIKTIVDGISFDSKKEAKRWGELKLLQRAGYISGLERQKRVDLKVNDQLICFYKSDFSYTERGNIILEDVKSEVTRVLPVYRIKKKLVKALLNIEIKEV